MRKYDVLVQWLVPMGRADYKRKTEWFRAVEAESILNACAKALQAKADFICPSVSMCWPSVG